MRRLPLLAAPFVVLGLVAWAVISPSPKAAGSSPPEVPSVVSSDPAVELPSQVEASTPEAEPTVQAAPTAADAQPVAAVSWSPSDEEVEVDAKRLASSVALALTTYPIGASVEDLATTLISDLARRARLVDVAGPLVHDGHWSVGSVVYPQMGGLRPESASVMVVVRQDVGQGDEVRFTQTRTIDVRLVRVDGAWVLDEVASIGGTPVARPADLPPEAVAVLDDASIVLPDSARWDIYRGAISLDLLRVMADLAQITPYGVVVLESGHPYHVFATDRTSRHTVGQAVDVYRLRETTVVDDRADGAFAREVADWLYAHPLIVNLGGPWALDGVGGRSFTDAVHQDHFHIAVAS